ncbi:MAG: chorismate mutase [Buchnera aphidicola (Meitanaphis microgallis)]
MKSTSTLLKLRNIINTLDKDLITLLAKRKTTVIQIAKTKIEQNYPIRDIEREQLLLKNLTIFGKKNNLDDKYIYDLFNIIIKDSIFTQNNWIRQNYCQNKKLKSFSFLGDAGSYSYDATKKYANKHFQFFIKNSCNNFEEIIHNVEDNKSDYAVLPIENNTSGSIYEIYALLIHTTLSIVGEINIPINHCLLSQKNTQLINIKKIYSHKQPFMQCSEFIKHFPNWKLKHTNSTTDAMEKTRNDTNFVSAALGNETCKKKYQLKVLSRNISNLENNVTRFIILRKKSVHIPNHTPTITTIMMSINNKKNLTEETIQILKKYNLKIRKLIPYKLSKTSSDITIFIDIKNNIHTDQIKQAINKLNGITSVKILGCYPIDKCSL